MLQEGSQAPDFTLQNQSGESISLNDFRGQWTVVYFYPRADTPGCTTEACGFRDRWDEFSARSIPVLGISDDPVEDLAAFADKYELPFDLLSDPNGSVSQAYDSWGEKNVFGNTVEGVFRNTYLINPDGKISRAYENVSPDGHAEDILADIPAEE